MSCNARVAELADAPDLGLQNHRFQSVASRFKTKLLHDRKTPNFPKILHSANPEQKTRQSSTNSRTRTHRSQAHERLIIGGGCGTSRCAHNLRLPVNRFESERWFHRARNSTKCSR